VSNHKITVVGAGNVGATTAHIAASRNLGQIVLLDIVKGLAEGKALDIAEAGPVQGYESSIIGTMDWEKTAGSSIVVITSGLARKPGMSRDDLLAKNVQIIKQVSENIVKYCPDSIVIVVANPLDAMVYTASKVTGFDKKRIMGMAGALDAARFSYFVAAQLGVSSQDVRGILMGGHGDDMVPLPRYTSVAGIPVTQLIPEKRLEEIVQRTKMGGGEIVKLMGTSAYYAPSAGTIQMAEAIIRDKRRIFPCAAYCDKEYGVGGYFVGVPCMLGSGGVEKVIEVELSPAERDMLTGSVNHVKELVQLAEKFLKA
jgi:malate dehydrogenase